MGCLKWFEQSGKLFSLTVQNVDNMEEAEWFLKEMMR